MFQILRNEDATSEEMADSYLRIEREKAVLVEMAEMAERDLLALQQGDMSGEEVKPADIERAERNFDEAERRVSACFLQS